MEREALQLKFFQIVSKSLRHKHYNHVVAKHKKYMQLVAGVNLDDMLKQYVRREDKELFKQRVAITKHITTTLCENLIDPYYKVPRSNSARRVLMYSGDNNETKIKELEAVISKYWGAKSLDEWMRTRYIELNAIDPNRFVIHEWKAFNSDIELAQPYPYEISSENAIYYKYINNQLEYVVGQEDIRYKVKADNFTNVNNTAKVPEVNADTTPGKKYTMYAKNQTFQLIQVSDTIYGAMLDVGEGEIQTIAQDGKTANYVKLGDLYYEYVEYLPHDCDEVPGFRVGYYRDYATNGETYVNFMHKVEPYIEKTIKVNSELDLVATLLAFPQMIKYGQPCEDTNCYKGYYDNNKVCNTCHGTGLKASAPSAQDAIVIETPESREQMIPLSEMVKYLSPDVAIVEWQEQYIDKLTTKCRQLMFNSEVFTKSEVSDTATGKNLDMQNVYDTLYPFATQFAATWTSSVRFFAKLTERYDGLIAAFHFGKDFKLKSLDTLQFDLALANNNGNAHLIRHINDDIAHIIYDERPQELQRYKVKEIHNPFAGKGEKEILFLMSSAYVAREEKVLYANYGKIFDLLEIESAKSKKNFYELNRVDQRAAIYAEVDKIIAEIDAQTLPIVPLGE